MFAAPEYFYCLSLLPFIGGIFWYGNKKKDIKYSQLFSKKIRQSNSTLKLKPQNNHWIRIVAAISLIIIALAQPQFGEKWRHQYQSSVDIVIALDLSASMLATDISPNRMQRAKQEIHLLLNKLQGHRIALIGFAQDAFTHVPLTHDHAIINLFLDELDVGLISSSGSKFRDLFEKASYLLRKSPKNERILLIVSDGEIMNDDLEKSIDIAIKKNITVMSIGIGTLKGAPIPNPYNKGIGYIKNAQDKVVISTLNPKSLKTLSHQTNGTYQHSTPYELSANKLYKAIKNTESTVYKNKQKQQQIPRFHSIITIAVLLLLLDLARVYQLQKPGTRK